VYEKNPVLTDSSGELSKRRHRKQKIHVEETLSPVRSPLVDKSYPRLFSEKVKLKTPPLRGRGLARKVLDKKTISKREDENDPYFEEKDDRGEV